MKVLFVTALLLAGCHTVEELIPAQQTGHSQESLFALIDGAIGGKKIAGPTWSGGETIGRRLKDVESRAPIRKSGFSDGDLLSRVCGLSIDQFVKAPAPVCCSHPTGAVFQFRRPGVPMRSPTLDVVQPADATAGYAARGSVEPFEW